MATLTVQLEQPEVVAVRNRLLHVLMNGSAEKLSDITEPYDPDPEKAKDAWERIFGAAQSIASISWLPDGPEEGLGIVLDDATWRELLDVSLTKVAADIGDTNAAANTQTDLERLEVLRAGHEELGLWLGIRDACHAARVARDAPVVVIA